MRYLDSFKLATESEESGFVLSDIKLWMSCYSDNVYPFKVFPPKKLVRLDFEDVTFLCGSNGSGKSTLLNVIAQKLELMRSAPFNNTPYFSDYLGFCEFEARHGGIPKGSRIITSDEVFDFLLDIRSVNEKIENRREQLFDEYLAAKNTPFRMRTLEDYEEFKRRNEAKRSTMNAYTVRRLPEELYGKSNGESAFSYFTSVVKENALYLLDEPENSLSVKLQEKLLEFIADSARFYRCQFIISTHSPFLLSMKGAKIYDMDSLPVKECRWTEIGSVRESYDFFKSHSSDFD